MSTKLLAERYPVAEGWCFMEEVTPPGLPSDPDRSPRRFDGIAISLWPSMGEIVHGFEIKASRADFLNEIRQPAKAGSLMRWCDFWWLVCPPGIAQDHEVPATWGILNVLPSGLRQKRRGPQLKPIQRDADWWRCMLLRKSRRDYRTPDELEIARREGFKEGRESGIEEGKRGTDYTERTYQALVKRVDAFEEASGIRLDQWSETSNAQAAALFKALRGKPYHSVASTVARAARQAEESAKALREAADALAGATGEADDA